MGHPVLMADKAYPRFGVSPGRVAPQLHLLVQHHALAVRRHLELFVQD